jgi:hypothetical protein
MKYRKIKDHSFVVTARQAKKKKVVNGVHGKVIADPYDWIVTEADGSVVVILSYMFERFYEPVPAPEEGGDK